MIIADYPRDLSTDVEVGVGDLTVVVPDNARVQVDARVGIGAIDALGSTRSGYRRALTLDDNTGGTPTITLKLRVGVGNIEVRRGSFFDGPDHRPADPPDVCPPCPVIPPCSCSATARCSSKTAPSASATDRRIEADGTYQIPIVAQNPDGSVQLENGAMIQADGTVVSPDGFVILRPAKVTDVPTTTATTILIPSEPTEVQP